MSKAARRREFSEKAREEIYKRDQCKCIFCEMGYKTEDADWFAKQIKSVMHYVPRSKNGLGIPENGAVGCQYHHDMMDNGNQGNRAEMLSIFRAYLKSKYPDWDESKLSYSKWREIEQWR